MSKRSKVSAKVTIGMDIGDKYCYLYVLDAQGEFVEESRVTTTRGGLEKKFAATGPARVAIETGTHSPWIYRLLEDLGHEVLVANSRKLRVISESNKKTDRADAKTLAEVAYARPSLLNPIQHRPVQAQIHMARLRARKNLVDARTNLINHTRGVVKSNGSRLPSCSSVCFPERVKDSIPKELKPVLNPHLKMIKALNAQIRWHDKALQHLCKKVYPETERLQQVDGVGPLTALMFMLSIADPKRFPKSRTVGSYVGLTPRKADSGSKQTQLSITKAGDRDLRSLLVGSAHYILGRFGPDCDLKRFGLKLAARGGKNAKKRAVVAVARKLAVLLHALWISGDEYERLRNSDKRRRRSKTSGDGAQAA